MSAQKQDHPSIKIAIVGTSGAGKSTLFEKLIRRENARWVFLYDHKDGDLARRFRVKACFDGEQVFAAIERGDPVVIYNPSKEFPGKPELGFEFFCELLWSLKSALRGKKVWGCDELDALVDARCEPEPMCKILDQGRTFQFDGIFIAQSMNGIHNQVRKQFTEIFALMQGDKNGLAWLLERGFDLGELNALTYGEWLYKNRLTGESEKGGTAFVPKNAKRDLRGL